MRDAEGLARVVERLASGTQLGVWGDKEERKRMRKGWGLERANTWYFRFSGDLIGVSRNGWKANTLCIAEEVLFWD